jgi:hypothetical protein
MASQMVLRAALGPGRLLEKKKVESTDQDKFALALVAGIQRFYAANPHLAMTS